VVDERVLSSREDIFDQTPSVVLVESKRFTINALARLPVVLAKPAHDFFGRSLKHLGEPTGTPDELLIRHRIRQDDLAALAHVARENASRIMSEWTKRKIIDRRSSLGFVIHKVRLEREARFSE
jgi:hypothetical protein